MSLKIIFCSACTVENYKMKVFEVSKANGEISLPKEDVHQMTAEPRHSELEISKGPKMTSNYRYFTAVFGFLMMSMVNSHRVNIGVAILKMTKNSTIKLSNKTEDVGNQDSEYFDWSPEIQGYVLAAGNLGYIILQLPTGRLAERFGSKVVLLSGLLCSSLANVLSPCAARFHPMCLVIVQLVKGLGMVTLAYFYLS